MDLTREKTQGASKHSGAPPTPSSETENCSLFLSPCLLQRVQLELFPDSSFGTMGAGHTNCSLMWIQTLECPRVCPIPLPCSASRPGDELRECLSWKVRHQTIILWFFRQMSKLYRARSLLCRRQILQENIRWKALDEIYKIYMLLHRSDLNISEKFRQTFSHFSAKNCKLSNLM